MPSVEKCVIKKLLLLLSATTFLMRFLKKESCRRMNVPRSVGHRIYRQYLNIKLLLLLDLKRLVYGKCFRYAVPAACCGKTSQAALADIASSPKPVHENV